MKISSTGNNYPQTLFTSDSNLNIRPGSVLSMWLYVDAPEDYEYETQFSVEFQFTGQRWGTPPAGLVGDASNRLGEWIKFSMTLSEEHQTLTDLKFNMLIRGTSVVSVSPLVSLYIDDIRLEPYTEGDLTYFVEDDTFSLADMQTKFCNGNGEEYPAEELVVTDAEGELIAVGVTMPSLSRALQRAKGKMFPFGWVHMLKALFWKHPDTLDLLLIAVKPEYQNKGVNGLLFSDLIKVYNRKGYKWAESNPELELNEAVQRQWDYFEHTQHKRRRAYKKQLTMDN